jgi:hypothetical protein
MINNFKEDDLMNYQPSTNTEDRPSSPGTTGADNISINEAQPSKPTKIDELCCNIQNLTSVLNKCYESVKVNQQMINNLMIMSIRLNDQMKNPQTDQMSYMIKQKYHNGLNHNLI